MNTRAKKMFSSSENVEIQRKIPANQPEQTSAPALKTVSAYSSFVTNRVFEECRPFEQFVYAAVQYLLFHGIKPSCRNISKHVNFSEKVIKNALCSLRKQRFIVKQLDGTYLFQNTKLDGSTELLGAKEITDTRLGYWFPTDILKNDKITNQAKRAYAVILSLTKSGRNQIDMKYIGKKMGLSREKASQPIACLLREGLMSRYRSKDRIPYTYKVGAKAMSHKQDLSTADAANRANFEQNHPDVTPKGNPNVTSLSIIKPSSVSKRDSRTEREPMDSDKNSENKALYFWKAEEIRLDVEYTKACVGLDWPRMCEISNQKAVVSLNLMNARRARR